jgi:hypothetical protein
MIGLAESRTFAQERERRSEWAPYRTASREDDDQDQRRFSGFSVLAALFLFSSITVAVPRMNASLAVSYGISQSSLLVAAWLVQGAAALFCFALAVRWLRS